MAPYGLGLSSELDGIALDPYGIKSQCVLSLSRAVVSVQRGRFQSRRAAVMPTSDPGNDRASGVSMARHIQWRRYRAFLSISIHNRGFPGVTISDARSLWWHHTNNREWFWWSCNDLGRNQFTI